MVINTFAWNKEIRWYFGLRNFTSSTNWKVTSHRFKKYIFIETFRWNHWRHSYFRFVLSLPADSVKVLRLPSNEKGHNAITSNKMTLSLNYIMSRVILLQLVLNILIETKYICYDMRRITFLLKPFCQYFKRFVKRSNKS